MENLADQFLRLSNPLYRLAFSRLGSKLEAEAAVQEAFKKSLEEQQLFQAVRDLAPQRSLQFDWIESAGLKEAEREQWVLAQRAIRGLPEEQRENLILRSLCGLTLAEVAAVQETPLNVAAERHRLALEGLEVGDLWLQSLPTTPVDEAWKNRVVLRLRGSQQARLMLRGGLVLGLAGLLGMQVQPWLEKFRPREGALPRTVHHVKVRGLEELDGKSLPEILALRRQAVAQMPYLGKLWRPDKDLQIRPTWKEIESGKRWLGLQGQLESSNEDFGKRFHEGESMESFFLLNPLALVGLHTCYVCQQNDLPGKLEGARKELVPASLVVDGPNQRLELTYQIGTDSPVRDRQPEGQFTHTLQLMNAYEMGFLYYSIEPGSQGFTRVPESKLMETAQFYKPMRIKHGTEVANQLYIRSAGFALIRLESVPAQLKLKLWRNNPGHVTDPADVTEVIQVVE